MDHVIEQVFLRLDVVIQTALERAQPVSDVLQGGRFIALLIEHVGGDLNQFRPAFLARLALAAAPPLRPSCWLPHYTPSFAVICLLCAGSPTSSARHPQHAAHPWASRASCSNLIVEPAAA